MKLGMGYDKGDIAFVIHYQAPSNIVSYYQQIGRAGRNISDAYAFLMAGGEDDKRINNFFIETARFSDELVERSAEVLMPIVNQKGVKAITFVPSLRSDIVSDFASRLASRMKIVLCDSCCRLCRFKRN